MSLPLVYTLLSSTAPFATMQTAPAYTSVAARQTLQRQPPAADAPKPKKVTWSPAVRQYVQRAFEADNAISGIDTPTMQDKLKLVITQAAESGHIDLIDWSTYPLPQNLIKAERDQAALYGAQEAILANINATAPPFTDGAYSPGFKRKSLAEDSNGMQNHPPTPPLKRIKPESLEDRITGRVKNQDKKQKKAEALRLNGFEADAELLAKRRQRFGYVTPEPSPYMSSRDESPEPVRTGPLVGTCQDLEKSYFRLTAPPPPETVRPLPVLEKALNYVVRRWRKEHNYRYACDQFKSLRQDLTVQHIRNETTVRVYETHARIALEMKDLGEYNQCQTQLRALYKLKLGGNPEEFTAYRILYIIYTCNRTDMNDVLADLTPADKRMDGVRHALAVRSALAAGNYHKFFNLYLSAPFMCPYLLDMIIQRERLAAMSAICKAYKPDVSIRFLTDELAFQGDDNEEDPDAGARQCVDFLCHAGGEKFVEQRGDGDIRFMCSKAAGIFEGAKQAAFRSVDIKGQI